MVTLKTDFLKNFISEQEILSYKKETEKLHEKIHKNSDSEGDFRGWVSLPVSTTENETAKIKSYAEKIKSMADVFIVIGVGGSYLGASAAIEFLKSPNYNYVKKGTPDIFFVGNNCSESAVSEILEICKEKSVAINVISKSGSTLEPAIAFNIFKNFIEKKYGKSEAKKRIFCTTGRKGILRNIADSSGYATFDIPENIGGRFSVLTAVGLLPIAVCGADIGEILKGAKQASEKFSDPNLNTNDCYKYAVVRNILHKKGKKIELITGYEPRLQKLFEWWKQLFGESEGKNGKGIFPASSIFSADLHSLGQFIQEGSKILFETVVLFEESLGKLKINVETEDSDGLNFLKDKSLSEINEIISRAVISAHTSGDVPNVCISLKNNSEYALGYLFYFFEKACAMSAMLLGVEPFDQPGVEAYKKNMMELLKKV